MKHARRTAVLRGIATGCAIAMVSIACARGVDDDNVDGGEPAGSEASVGYSSDGASPPYSDDSAAGGEGLRDATPSSDAAIGALDASEPIADASHPADATSLDATAPLFDAALPFDASAPVDSALPTFDASTPTPDASAPDSSAPPQDAGDPCNGTCTGEDVCCTITSSFDYATCYSIVCHSCCL